MCQYCGNTGLCYFVFTYGFVWLYKKISLYFRNYARKKKPANKIRIVTFGKEEQKK
jgi:hypothetical protein